MPKSILARAAWRLLQFLAVLYFGILLLIFVIQRKLIYQPARDSLDSMLQTAREHHFEAWQNPAGQFIGWKQISPLKRPHPRLLILHGNAGCAIDRVEYADALQLHEPMDVYILEYPGYGARSGSPGQDTFLRAATEALDLLKPDNAPIYLLGESLGTGVACYLAGANPGTVSGLLLIAPYDSLTSVAQARMPLLPVRLLLRDRFPSAAYLKNYHGPIAMLFAGRDVIVPNRFGHRLYDGYSGPKKFWEIPAAGHNDLIQQPDPFWQELLTFWKSSTSPPAEGRGEGEL